VSLLNLYEQIKEKFEKVFVIVGADQALELDAARAIRKGAELAEMLD
jgi:hypothetical protein